VKRIINVLICVDQLIFSIVTLGSAAPDETMSAAAWRLENKGSLAGSIFRPLIDTLFWFDKCHCRQAYEAEINRYQRAK